MTKQIPLTQGKVAIVDDEDFETVSRHNWHAIKSRSTHYAYTHIRISKGRSGRKHIAMHCLILGKSELLGDHKDGDGLNNTRSNLRLCTPAQSQQNRACKVRVGKSSQYKGVYRDRNRNKWQAGIETNNKHTFLGNFTEETDAARAYDKAAKELFGEFARLNFPERQTQ